MRILIAFCSLFLVLACKPKTTPPSLPAASSLTVKEKTGVYLDATVYAGKTDYAFEIDGQTVLFGISNMDSVSLSKIPSNLTDPLAEALPGANPILIGKKYNIEYDDNNQIKKISLLGPHDPSNVELPAIPNNYSGLLAVAPAVDSRAYLNLEADLSAMLLIDYGKNENKVAKYGRWTRSNYGTTVNVQLADEVWNFMVKENALVLVSSQMGSGGLTVVSTGKTGICDYVYRWLSDLSSTDGETQIPVENINHKTPLADILRTEHAYMGLYGDLEITFGVNETDIAEVLRHTPTVQGVCDLVMHNTGGGH